MKIAIFSDSHGELPEINSDYKTIMICGDICPIKNHSIAYQDAWLNIIFLSWIEKNNFDKVILVPGNHDYIFEQKHESYLRNLEILTKNVLKILINESTSIYDENGKEIHVYGTPYCKLFGNWAFMKNYEELKIIYDNIPNNLDILLCHDAPDINGQGLILESPYAGKNAGNVELALAILRSRPKRLFHGHIHSSPRENQFEEILMNNVSIKNEKYQSVFPVTYIDL